MNTVIRIKRRCRVRLGVVFSCITAMMVGSKFPIAQATALVRSVETEEEDPEGVAVTTVGTVEDKTDEEGGTKDTTPADKLFKVVCGRTRLECSQVKNLSAGKTT